LSLSAVVVLLVIIYGLKTKIKIINIFYNDSNTLSGTAYSAGSIVTITGGISDHQLGTTSGYKMGLIVQHSSRTQGLGIGYNGISQCGSETDLSLHLRAKGTGTTQIGSSGGIAQYLDHSILTSTSSSTQFADEINSVISGDSIASFICEGSSSRYSTTEQIISTVRELSNSILGGPNAYPDGPDTLTIFLRRISGASTSAFARISWSEAQG
jgi:uncharacterized protein YebE (UPF0316 family)